MRCDHCTVAAGLHCPGEDAARLCRLTNSAHPDYQPGYLSSIQAHARPRSDETARPSIAEAFEFVRRMRACPYRSRYAGCGCSGAQCALRRGAIVSYHECFECSSKYDPGPDDGPYDDQS